MKRFKYWVALILILNLFLCGYDYRGPSMKVQEVKEDYDTGYNTFNTLKVEGKYITLPCKFHLLTDLGFVLKDWDSKLVLEPKTYYTMIYAYNNEGDIAVVDIVNISEEEQPIAECLIYELSFDLNKSNKTSLNVEISDLTFLSSIKEAKAVFGNDCYESDIYEGIMTLGWSTEKYDRDIRLSYDERVGLVSITASVEIPTNVEYFDTAYEEEYGIDEVEQERSNQSSYLDAPVVSIRSNKYDDVKILVGKIIVYTCGIIACIITAIVVACYMKQKQKLEKEQEQKQAEQVSIEEQLEIPESSYLEEKYKDYL